MKQKQFEHLIYGYHQTIHIQQKLPMTPKNEKVRLSNNYSINKKII